MMQQHQLFVQARFRPEVIERILRVVRHRGFSLCALNVTHPHDKTNVNIELTVASQRPIDLLSVQLQKLLDVAHVKIQTSAKTITSQSISA